MAKELTPVDVSSVPELLEIAERVKTTGEPCVLKRADEELAIITPVKPARRPRKTGFVTKDDPLIGLVGIGRSGIPGGVSAKKHEYLARAYRPT